MFTPTITEGMSLSVSADTGLHITDIHAITGTAVIPTIGMGTILSPVKSQVIRIITTLTITATARAMHRRRRISQKKALA
jgi:hypothetical protein